LEVRDALEEAGLENTPILSYASKFASAFYGPFREAADSAPQFGDRKTYQMDGANVREAMREIELDLDEGADMILMKPAMPYLDVVRAARDRFDVPMGAYQVSGEYSMLQAAFEKGWVAGGHAAGGRGFRCDLFCEGRGEAAGVTPPNATIQVNRSAMRIISDLDRIHPKPLQLRQQEIVLWGISSIDCSHRCAMRS